MNKFWMCLLAAMAFSGAGYAQMGGEEEDIEGEVKAEVDMAFEAMDGDSDGKITKAEVKAGVMAEGYEDESGMDFIEAYGYMLMDFLSADANDDLEVTKAELTASLTAQYEGEYTKLSKADVKILDDEYYIPGAKAVLKLVDANGDGKASKAEAEAAGGDGFGEVDLNGDGEVTVLEIRKSLHAETEAMYEVAEYEFGEDGADSTDEEADIPQAVKDSFAELDGDGDGNISKAEIKKAFNANSKAEWWGVYIAYTSMDADDSGLVDINEFFQFGSDENNDIPHKVYPSDKDTVMTEIWGDMDADEDGKVSKDEFANMFPESNEYGQWDADKNGDLSKDEFWDGLFPSLGEAYVYEKEDKRTGIGGDESSPAEDTGEATDGDDAYALYKKVGRTWTHKSVTKMMGTESVTYTKWEVLEVTGTGAKCKMTIMDANKNETYSTEHEVKFATGTAEGDAGDVEAPEIVEETITVEAGEFACTKIVVEVSGNTTTSWSSKDMPALLVKSVTKGGQMESSMELVEFED